MRTLSEITAIFVMSILYFFTFKARMVREGEIFHYERRIKQKKLEILEILKSKLENQQSVNLDVLTL